MSQQQQPREVSFAEYITNQRNEIKLVYSNAQELALRHYDDIANKLAQQMQAVDKLQKEKDAKLAKEVKPKEDKDKSRNKK